MENTESSIRRVYCLNLNFGPFHWIFVTCIFRGREGGSVAPNQFPPIAVIIFFFYYDVGSFHSRLLGHLGGKLMNVFFILNNIYLPIVWLVIICFTYFLLHNSGYQLTMRCTTKQLLLVD